MSVWALIFLFLFVTAASFTQRVTGFGFGIIVMTVLPYLLPSYGEATALSGLLAVFTALLPAVRMRRLLPWRKLAVILPVFLLVSFFAVRLVTRVDSDLLRHILGGVLVAVSVYFICVSGRFRLPPRLDVQAGMGALSGLMGGLFAMQGPPAVIYFLGCSDSKEEYIALTQWYFLIGNAAMTIFRAGNGFVTPVVIKSWLLAVPAVLAGLWIGTHIYKRIRLPLLRKVVYAYMAFAGLLCIIL